MKFLRDPLLHFLVIGAVLFGVFHWAGASDEAATGEIIVTAGQIASMEAVFRRTWQRPPDAKEVDALISDYIRDEVLYREGVAIGLDQDDPVVRRRVRQKMEFVADLVADAEPTEAELKTFVADHPNWFSAEPRFSFQHVYFQENSGDGTAAADSDGVLQALNDGRMDASAVGDAFMAGFDFNDLTKSQVEQTFGENFAAWIDRAKSGEWQGPVTSVYGTHLVRLNERVDAGELPFEQVREAARREWMHARKVAANDALYDRLKSRYVITVEEPRAADAEKVAGVAP